MNISDKVVCVDDSPGKNSKVKSLELGKVYVIEGVGPTPRPNGPFGLHLVGVPSYVSPRGTVLGWVATRFRLLADLKAEAAATAAQQPLTTTK